MELSLFRTSISNTLYKTANDAIYRAIDLMEHEYTGPDDHTRMVQILKTDEYQESNRPRMEHQNAAKDGYE